MPVAVVAIAGAAVGSAVASAVAGSALLAGLGITGVAATIVGGIAGVAVGALTAGVVNVAMGGDFKEGAMMGGLAAAVGIGVQAAGVVSGAESAIAASTGESTLGTAGLSAMPAAHPAAALGAGNISGILTGPVTGSTATASTSLWGSATKWLGSAFKDIDKGELIAGALKGYGEWQGDKLKAESERYAIDSKYDFDPKDVPRWSIGDPVNRRTVPINEARTPVAQITKPQITGSVTQEAKPGVVTGTVATNQPLSTNIAITNNPDLYDGSVALTDEQKASNPQYMANLARTNPTEYRRLLNSTANTGILWG